MNIEYIYNDQVNTYLANIDKAIHEITLHYQLKIDFLCQTYNSTKLDLIQLENEYLQIIEPLQRIKLKILTKSIPQLSITDLTEQQKNALEQRFTDEWGKLFENAYQMNLYDGCKPVEPMFNSPYQSVYIDCEINEWNNK